MKGPPAAVSRAIKKLARLNLRDYHQSPLPGSVDAEILELVRAFAAAPPPLRLAFQDHVTNKHSYALLVFSERMAALAVRERNEEHVRNGLAALALEAFDLDLRESLPIMCLLDHSSRKIGASSEALFQEAASLGPPETAAPFLEFLHRSPALRRIDAMGFQEAMTPDGFRYQRTW